MEVNYDAQSSHLQGLNEAQLQAVVHRGSPLLIVAGAGSGKTRALTERLAHLIESGQAAPWQILAITFTNKAAQEMRERVSRRVAGAERIWIMTFHQASVRILRREADRVGYPRDFAIYDTQDQGQVVRQVLRGLNLDERRYPPAGVLHRISREKNDLRRPDDLRRDGGFYEEQVARIWEAYQERLQELGAFDFDDLIGVVVGLLEGDEEVRKHWQQRFEHLLVDEYQDTNQAQYRWVKALAGARQQVAVVGDPDQSIYGWRGADIRNILEFERDFENVRTVFLTQNYRSTGRILSLANAVVRHNQLRREKDLWTAQGEGEPVELVETPDDREESEWIARQIKQLVADGTPATEIAVLYRTNAQSRTHEEALIRHAIPYRLVGGVRFYERLEIRDLLGYLRLVQNVRDDLALRRVINAPKRGLGDAAVDAIARRAAETGRSYYEAIVDVVPTFKGQRAKALQSFYDLIATLRDQREHWPPSQLLAEIAQRSGYLDALRAEGSIEAQSRIENIDALLDKAREAEADELSLEDFLARVALLSDIDEAADAEAKVTLMTLHAAKGLEFDVVFLSGLEEGLLPHSRAAYEERELEEERRLFYVGITRARRRLWLLRALRRMQRGEVAPSVPSRFLRDIPPNLVAVQAPTQADRLLPRGRRMPVSSYRGQPSAVVAVGDRVRHPKFGEGTVVQLRAQDDDQEITVAFAGAGLRKLLSRYASLQKIEE